MVDKHDQSFFGQKVGLILRSPSKTKHFIFIQCVKNKGNGKWEKPSLDEGRTIRLSLEEIITINLVLKGKLNEWIGYHPYKNRDPNISVSWEGDKKEKLWFNIGEYKKPFENPQLKILSLLLKHLIKEKIEFATIPSNIPVEKKVLTSEKINPPDLIDKQEILPNKVEAEKIEGRDQDSRKIYGSIKTETEKALLLIFQNGQEVWIPKSRIYSDYNTNISTEQTFIISDWILTQNGAAEIS